MLPSLNMQSMDGCVGCQAHNSSNTPTDNVPFLYRRLNICVWNVQSWSCFEASATIICMDKRTQICVNCCKYVEICRSMWKYAEVCRSLQRYAEVCRNMRKFAEICGSMRRYSEVCRNTQKFAEICGSMQKYAEVCRNMQKFAENMRKCGNLQMQKYAEICEDMQKYAEKLGWDIWIQKLYTHTHAHQKHRQGAEM